MKSKAFSLLLIVLMLIVAFNFGTIQAVPAGFVYTSGQNFMLDGSVFRFGGANNYYLNYKSTVMIDDVLNDAVAMNLKVIRCWAFLDGSSKDGFVMQPSLGVYNDDGFKRLDYTLYRAEALGLKLILPLVNNWDEFGGMNQYVSWTGAGSHDAFYTNKQCKQGYKNYINYIVNRTNSYTGKKYKDSPGIFAWELANEPRCQSDPTGYTLVNWADEMSSYIKSLDPYHMVAVGDEGFFKRSASSDWTYNGGEGVDWESLIALQNIDFGTVHLYPDHWNKSIDWGTQWIKDHANQSKPVILEEFGIHNNKDSVYQNWCNTVLKSGYAGSSFWILTGIQDDGNLYPDYDGFRVTYPSSTATILADHAVAMAADNSQTPTPTPTIPTQPGVYQAEDAYIYHGLAATNHSGYTGTGFVDYTNEAGSYVEWTINVSQSGNQTLTFRYANGTTSNRTMDIYVNDSRVISNMAFYGTGAWDSWSTQTANVYLNSGSNSIRATANTSNGGPNVDYLQIANDNVTPTPTPTSTPTPTVTPTPTPTSTNTPGCTVSYEIQNDWGSGATINVTIKNNGSSDINNWTLAWIFPGNQQITNLWNGSYIQSGTAITIQNLFYNAPIPANGGTVNFGFNISYSGFNAEPDSFSLNGKPCRVL